ncbi:uncharacterized protein BDZ99DRAFT_19130 [Mytilinidion resinicola]|uniref:Uncharacterized protein n=1 Tax=Mytilinidion resinicola TaxID=574789 RepID=A0A6A6ZB91_9PEZI|nr:uncharacterized protein BDZ99DRAFT_19130 [Mytilinidion resinicola]KAF2817574.1 hypothetical protein BDZ99DRAFT_19130 [Mytilinidion resinicola]
MRREDAMASPLIGRLSRPVRFLIRTRPVQLEKIHPSVDKADTELLEQFWTQISGRTDTTEICHLITKISDRKGSDRVDIVFDYGVPLDADGPNVMAFDVKCSDSRLIVKRLASPAISPKVNETVKWWREINLEHNISFPSRTDVRRKGRA